ncbi:hypothetical protein [Robinsoniella peoriensis]|uniref:hypothetical protein n=1 Tax=Robinsoniella peoriensis TaxID=180332 RepID=UPI003753DB78
MISYDFRHLDLFEKSLNAEDMKFVTTESEIIKYLNNVSELYASESARIRLVNLKKCMYFSSFSHQNPMYFISIKKALGLTDELIHIHELMYLVLSDEKHLYLKFLPSECSLDGYKACQFSWHVPHTFMPFLAAYILATADFKHSKNHLAQFYEVAEQYLAKALDQSSDYVDILPAKCLGEIFPRWTNEYLGRQYFTTLDALYKTYSKNTEQHQILRDSVKGLTYLLLECNCHPSPIPTYIYMLLEHFQKQLHTVTHQNAMHSLNLTSLYEHSEQLVLNDEKATIKNIANQLLKMVAELFSFIDDYLKKNHIEGAKYELSIHNFDCFYSKFCSFIFSIEQEQKEIESLIRSYFFNVNSHPNIKAAVSIGNLTISQQYEEKHIQIFSTLIINTFSEIIDSFNKFLTKVFYASEPNPEKHKKLTVEHIYVAELKKTVSKTIQNFNENLETSFKYLPAILYFHDLGFLHKVKYPLDNFEACDILRFIDELTRQYRYLSSDHLIKCLQRQGIHFPLTRQHVIKFLLNFEQIIETIS